MQQEHKEALAKLKRMEAEAAEAQERRLKRKARHQLKREQKDEVLAGADPYQDCLVCLMTCFSLPACVDCLMTCVL